MDYLARVPADVWLMIIEDLDIRGLLAMRMTSRQLGNIIVSSVQAMYRLELEKHGYKAISYGGSVPISASDPNFTVAGRLDTLKDHVSAWETLDWDVSRHSLPSTSRAIWVAQGVLVTPFNDQFSVALLPSKVRNTSWRSWMIPAPEDAIEFLLLDPTSDLMIQSTRDRGADGEQSHFILHMRTITTGTPHPDASIPDVRLDVTPNFHDIISSRIIEGQFAGIFVALPASTDAEGVRLEIWTLVVDWRTGHILACSQIPVGPLSRVVFASLDTVLVVPTRGYSIDLVRLPLDGDRGSPSSSAHLVATYHLPQTTVPTSQWVTAFHASSTSESSNGPPMDGPSHSPLLDPFPFVPSALSNLIHGAWRIQADDTSRYQNPTMYLNLFMSPIIFTPEWIDSIPNPKATAIDGPLVIPWSKWRPHCTVTCRLDTWARIPHPVSTNSRGVFIRDWDQSVEIWDLSPSARFGDETDESLYFESLMQAGKKFGLEKLISSKPHGRRTKQLPEVDGKVLDDSFMRLFDDERLLFIEPAGHSEQANVIVLTM